MRYLRLISILLLFAACRTPYSHLPKIKDDGQCLQRLRPRFGAELYNTQVDVLNRHLSGLLLVKTMPDSSTRMVFSSEMGLKFFDFEFSPGGAFRVHSIIKQMNRRAVIKTLRKDFEALLMGDIQRSPDQVFSGDSSHYFLYRSGKTYRYYVTSEACSRLERIEIASKHKIKVQLYIEPGSNGSPDSVDIQHKNFHFNIGLKKLPR